MPGAILLIRIAVATILTTYNDGGIPLPTRLLLR